MTPTPRAIAVIVLIHHSQEPCCQSRRITAAVTPTMAVIVATMATPNYAEVSSDTSPRSR